LKKENASRRTLAILKYLEKKSFLTILEQGVFEGELWDCPPHFKVSFLEKMLGKHPRWFARKRRFPSCYSATGDS